MHALVAIGLFACVGLASGLEYTITVTVGSRQNSATKHHQYFEIKGEGGLTTGEHECVGTFDIGSEVSCTVTSDVEIELDNCDVFWRNGGKDRIIIAMLKVEMKRDNTLVWTYFSQFEETDIRERTVKILPARECTSLDAFGDHIKTSLELPVKHGKVVTVTCSRDSFFRRAREMECSDGEFKPSLKLISCESTGSTFGGSTFIVYIPGYRLTVHK